LYYRLNVFPLHLPPLRDRPDDIVPLAQRLLALQAAIQGLAPPALADEAQRQLREHRWPGNVRELDNLMQRALIMHRGDSIVPADLAFEPMAAVAPRVDAEPAASGRDVDATDGIDGLGDDLKAHERNLIIEALKSGMGSRKLAAERLGISPRTLRYKLARLREQGVVIPG
jgi:two-component system response regulator FlrC